MRGPSRPAEFRTRPGRGGVVQVAPARRGVHRVGGQRVGVPAGVAQGGEHIRAGHRKIGRQVAGLFRAGSVKVDDDQAGRAAGDPDVVRRAGPPGADAGRVGGGQVLPVPAQRRPLPAAGTREHGPAADGQGQGGSLQSAVSARYTGDGHVKLPFVPGWPATRSPCPSLAGGAGQAAPGRPPGRERRFAGEPGNRLGQGTVTGTWRGSALRAPCSPGPRRRRRRPAAGRRR